MLCLKVELLLGSCFKLGKSVRRPSGDIHLPISWLVTCHCTIKLKSYCLWICMMNIFDAPFLRNINLVSDNHPATDYVFWWSCDYGWEGPVWSKHWQPHSRHCLLSNQQHLNVNGSQVANMHQSIFASNWRYDVSFTWENNMLLLCDALCDTHTCTQNRVTLTLAHRVNHTDAIQHWFAVSSAVRAPLKHWKGNMSKVMP